MFRIATIALLFAAAGASAQQPPNPPGQTSQQQEHRGPPQEAFDACKGKKEGDAAQAKMPRGDVMSGTCRMVLVPGRPAERNQPQRERPPAK